MGETSDSCYDSAEELLRLWDIHQIHLGVMFQLAKLGGQESTREIYESSEGLMDHYISLLDDESPYMCIYIYYIWKSKVSKKINHQNTQNIFKEKKLPYFSKKNKTPFLPAKKRETTFITSSTSPPTHFNPYLGLIRRNIHQNHDLESWVSCTKMWNSTILLVSQAKCWYPCDGSPVIINP